MWTHYKPVENSINLISGNASPRWINKWKSTYIFLFNHVCRDFYIYSPYLHIHFYIQGKKHVYTRIFYFTTYIAVFNNVEYFSVLFKVVSSVTLFINHDTPFLFQGNIRPMSSHIMCPLCNFINTTDIWEFFMPKTEKKSEFRKQSQYIVI